MRNAGRGGHALMQQRQLSPLALSLSGLCRFVVVASAGVLNFPKTTHGLACLHATCLPCNPQGALAPRVELWVSWAPLGPFLCVPLPLLHSRAGRRFMRCLRRLIAAEMLNVIVHAHLMS